MLWSLVLARPSQAFGETAFQDCTHEKENHDGPSAPVRVKSAASSCSTKAKREHALETHPSAAPILTSIEFKMCLYKRRSPFVVAWSLFSAFIKTTWASDITGLGNLILCMLPVTPESCPTGSSWFLRGSTSSLLTISKGIGGHTLQTDSWEFVFMFWARELGLMTRRSR